MRSWRRQMNIVIHNNKNPLFKMLQFAARQPCTLLFRECVRSIFRTKRSTHEYTKLSKVMDMFDVTMLGLGTTIGMGSYVFIGYYAKEIGPAMIVSHVLAALVSFMNALCYAEFVSREPGSGGAYSQAYYLLGEFVAALIGWILIMENIVGAALSARGLSEVIDKFTGNKISEYVKTYITFENRFFADYPDVLACFAELIALTAVSFGLKEVTHLNNFIVFINVSLLAMIVLVFGANINFSNWTLPPSEGCGNGGFMPYGINSVLKGVNKVFNAYIGFDAAAHAGSEVSDPERTVPTALLLSVTIVTTLYLFQSFTHTLIWPYCDQDMTAPIQYTMKNIGMDIMRWVTAIGCPIGLIGNLISSTYPLTRLVYAIAEDGLIYSCMANINIHTKTPIIALYSTGCMTAIFALLFNKFQLAEITCLSALIAYCFVALCVLTLRYTDDDMEYGDTTRPIHKIIFNMEPSADHPTVISSILVLICSTLILISALPIQLLLDAEFTKLKKGKIFSVSQFFGIIIFYVLIILIIINQPTSTTQFGIQVSLPSFLKPLLPILCMIINAHICLEYSKYSWITLSIWMLVGCFIYFSYGIWKSKERDKDLYLEH